MEDLEMRTNEIEETEEVEEIEETPKHSGLGTIGAMAIGSGLTLGGIALFKKLKKVVAGRRAKKEAEEEPVIVDAEVIEEPVTPQPKGPEAKPTK